jgi:type IV/VI secretion system ImpK/VasF family protein
MTNDFGQRVYPVIRYVLDLLRTIRGGRSTPDPQLAAAELRTLLAQFDVQGPRRTEYQLARSALIYWADEVLVNSTWEYADYWSNHTLERSYFDARERASRFFEKAEVARGLENLDALETFYLCACFGFKGVYRDDGFRASSAPAKADSGDTWEEEQAAAEAASGQTATASAPSDQASEVNGDDWWENDDALKTWGIGGVELSESLLENLPGDMSVMKAPLAQRTRETQTATFQEWLESVYRQLAPAAQPPFAPANSPSDLGTATPLSGRSARVGSALMLALAGGLMLVLWIVLLYRTE